MIRVACLIIVAALCGCSAQPADIRPDTSTSTSHAISAAGAGGHGGDGAPYAAGAGGMGDGSGTHSESGTRLKVASYKGTDGSEFIRPEAYDSLLGFHCVFRQATDGTTRCFPLSWAASKLFADSECTALLIAAPECDVDSRRYATMYEWKQDAACSARTHRAFRLGEALLDPEAVYQMYNGTCTAISGSPGSFFYATEIPADELAAASKAVE